MANTALLFFKPTTQKDIDFSSTYHSAFLFYVWSTEILICFEVYLCLLML